MMHHMETDLKDIKQSRVPSLAPKPKPKDITPERTPQKCLLCGEIRHSHRNFSDACEPEVHENSMESNQSFLGHSEVSVRRTVKRLQVVRGHHVNRSLPACPWGGLLGRCPLEVLSKSLVQSKMGYGNDPVHYKDTRGNASVYNLSCVSVHRL
jgi:hypothetical protein